MVLRVEPRGSVVRDEAGLNRVGQIVQMDGYYVTTCLIVGRRPVGTYVDLFHWILVVLDEDGPPPYDEIENRQLLLNNHYIAKYAREIT